MISDEIWDCNRKRELNNAVAEVVKGNISPYNIAVKNYFKL